MMEDFAMLRPSDRLALLSDEITRLSKEVSRTARELQLKDEADDRANPSS